MEDFCKMANKAAEQMRTRGVMEHQGSDVMPGKMPKAMKGEHPQKKAMKIAMKIAGKSRKRK